MPKVNHDKLFKDILQLFFKDFFKAFFPEIYKNLDFSRFGPSNFLANEHIIDHGKKRKVVMDIVARVREKGSHDYVIVFIENQDYRDKEFAERVFSYFAAVYLRYRRPVVPIVIFTDNKRWEPTSEITDFTVGFGPYTFLRFHYLSVKLKNLDFRTYLRMDNPIAVALAAKMGYEKAEIPRLKIDILRTLMKMRLPENKLETLAQFVDTYTDIENDPEASRELYSLMNLEENKEASMLLTMFEKRGLKQGREEGRVEAKIEDAKKMIEKGITNADIRDITGLSIKKIQELRKKS